MGEAPTVVQPQPEGAGCRSPEEEGELVDVAPPAPGRTLPVEVVVVVGLAPPVPAPEVLAPVVLVFAGSTAHVPAKHTPPFSQGVPLGLEAPWRQPLAGSQVPSCLQKLAAVHAIGAPATHMPA